jgi:probable HAF family extracellular repeat protein
MYSIVGLEEPPGSQSVDAEAINNSGQVVGEASLSPYPHNRAYLWSEGVPQDLGELLFGTLETVLERPINNAYAINNSGQVVGASGAHAFLWDASNGVQDLGTLPGDQNSRASAIQHWSKHLARMRSWVDESLLRRSPTEDSRNH